MYWTGATSKMHMHTRLNTKQDILRPWLFSFSFFFLWEEKGWKHLRKVIMKKKNSRALLMESAMSLLNLQYTYNIL